MTKGMGREELQFRDNLGGAPRENGDRIGTSRTCMQWRSIDEDCMLEKSIFPWGKSIRIRECEDQEGM